ncbi:MAG: glutamate--cysteine ligase [Rhodobacteraceae bacterium]|nr:glutamate--cysteine ligase [Paracoccaceae bacterium]
MSIPQKGGKKIESFEQLVSFFEAGCKPKSQWLIGTEHEKFGFNRITHQPLPYEGECSIKSLLEGLRNSFNWQPIFEGENLIGLAKNGANISLEPGGQIELSGAPLHTLHETEVELNQHIREIAQIGHSIQAEFLAIGAAPEWTHEQMPILPKARYKLMTEYMKKVGRFGVNMMYRTSTVQVNLDYSSETDMVQKFRVALALQPVATALFANSPYFEGKQTGYMSNRSRFWQDLDSSRTGMLPFVFDEGFGFELWTNYALDVPMYFVIQNGDFLDARGLSFRSFMQGKLPILPNQLPMDSDWANHLTTIFPEVRIKKFMEMRGADMGSYNHVLALSAFWVGLIYDQTALDAAWDLVKGFDEETRENLRIQASKHGLKGAHNDIRILDLAREALKISEAGLNSRRQAAKGINHIDESQYLSPLKEALQNGLSQAEVLTKMGEEKWKGNLSSIYDYCRIGTDVDT